MHDGEERKKSKVGAIVFWIAVVALLAFLIPKAMEEEVTEDKQKQMEPESAMRFYGDKAYGYMHQTAMMDEIKNCVIKEDWQWFDDNYQSLQRDAFGLGSVIDPTQATALQRNVALMTLLSAGMDRGECEILAKTIKPEEAIFTIRKYPDDYTQEDIEVRVVKVGKFWRMTDFAGGRAKFERRSKSEIVPRTARPAVAAAPAAAAPGAAAPAPAGAQAAATAIPPEVDTEIREAATAWEKKDSAKALEHALKAQEIAQAKLPADHPKLVQIRSMIQAAQQTAAVPAGAASEGQAVAVPPEVDAEIREAGAAWDRKDFAASLAHAKKARAIAQSSLPKGHAKLTQIDGMIEAAATALPPKL